MSQKDVNTLYAVSVNKQPPGNLFSLFFPHPATYKHKANKAMKVGFMAATIPPLQTEASVGGSSNSSSRRPVPITKTIRLSQRVTVLAAPNDRHAPPGPCATFCATFIYAHLSTYYEYPSKKQTSSNMIKRGNENLNPARLPNSPLAREVSFKQASARGNRAFSLSPARGMLRLPERAISYAQLARPAQSPCRWC